MPDLATEVRRRCNFAIISHPDAGKTKLMEKLLLFSDAIKIAGSVKARNASRHATSDWMEIEKQRGIQQTLATPLQVAACARSYSHCSARQFLFRLRQPYMDASRIASRICIVL